MSQSKDYNKYLGLVSIFYILAGIILIIWPDIAVKIVCYIISAVLLIYGLIRILIYLRSDNTRRYFQFDLVVGIITIAFGLFILFKPVLFVSLLPFAIGLCILFDSIIKFQNAFDLKHAGLLYWQIPLAISIITAILGLMLVINPFGATVTLVRCMGIFFIVDGLANISSAILVLKKLGRTIEEERRRAKRKK
ncbi:MAG: DUF308 domain-containing protein [Clostridiales bacterium]|nr:DUF308 domain-containing protein [Clostridiales bacterium]